MTKPTQLLSEAPSYQILIDYSLRLDPTIHCKSQKKVAIRTSSITVPLMGHSKVFGVGQSYLGQYHTICIPCNADPRLLTTDSGLCYVSTVLPHSNSPPIASVPFQFLILPTMQARRHHTQLYRLNE